MPLQALLNRLPGVDVRPDSRGNQFRARRIELLKGLIGEAIQENGSCSLIDVGGTYNFWHVWSDEIDWDRTRIVCVNQNPKHNQDGKDAGLVEMRTGDACDLSDVGDKEFDVAFSNSVIEHVGDWAKMEAMAHEIKRVAGRYLVQTPNFWFPIEPHARTPFLHWLPEPWAYRIVMLRKCGFWEKQSSVSGAVRTVQSARLLDKAQMQALFDDARIIRERFMGLTKSLVAIKDSRGSEAANASS